MPAGAAGVIGGLGRSWLVPGGSCCYPAGARRRGPGLPRGLRASPLSSGTPIMKLQLMSIERDGMVKIATQGNITSADIDASGPNPLEQILGKNWFQSRVLL